MARGASTSAPPPPRRTNRKNAGKDKRVRLDQEQASPDATARRARRDEDKRKEDTKVWKETYAREEGEPKKERTTGGKRGTSEDITSETQRSDDVLSGKRKAREIEESDASPVSKRLRNTSRSEERAVESPEKSSALDEAPDATKVGNNNLFQTTHTTDIEAGNSPTEPKDTQHATSVNRSATDAGASQRIDTHPVQDALQSALGGDWDRYRTAMGLFISGQRTQAESAREVDGILSKTPWGERLHNRLVATIYANALRGPSVGTAED